MIKSLRQSLYYSSVLVSNNFNHLTCNSFVMDRLLRPERFTTDPNEADSEKRYKHWKTTLLNYLSTTLTVPATTDTDDVQAAYNRKRFFGLQNNVSHTIYELISDSTDFDAAIATLDNTYIKPRSVIYNRHKLMSSKQEPLQTIDSFMQSLEQISKTCNFEAVTAEQNRKQYLRDAFINGISSAHIRQRRDCLKVILSQWMRPSTVPVP